jgi:hypothetical protein
MTAPALFRVIFVIYCVEAGAFFLAAPWLQVWERLAFAVPWSPIRDLLLSTWCRAAIAGFGVVHLAWVIHDLDLFLRRPAGSLIASSETARGH